MIQVAPAIAEKQAVLKQLFQDLPFNDFTPGVTGNNLTLKEIVSRYQHHSDEVAVTNYPEIMQNSLVKRVSVVTNLLDPDVQSSLVAVLETLMLFIQKD